MACLMAFARFLPDSRRRHSFATVNFPDLLKAAYQSTCKPAGLFLHSLVPLSTCDKRKIYLICGLYQKVPKGTKGTKRTCTKRLSPAFAPFSNLAWNSYMSLKIPGALLLLTFFAACAQIPAKTDTKARAGKPEEKKEAAQAKLPSQDLTAPLLFDFLLAETALQRGDQELAIRTYLKLAKTTRDPRVAQRATEIALQSRQPLPALEAAKMWIELEPDSVSARQTVAALLVNIGQLDEARPHLEKLLASEGSNVGEAFMQLNSLLLRNPDKNATFELVKQLAQPYPSLPERSEERRVGKEC